MKLLKILSFPLFCAVLSAQAQSSNVVHISSKDTEKDILTKAASLRPSARQLRWQNLELTAFFHFGINTMTNKEWGDGKEDISTFNPEGLDAKQWVRTVKEAGFKQVIITAKHHDGFCLWPSKYTEHSIKNTPYKNGKGDVVQEVAQACKMYGIGFGVYLSPWDRNHPDYGDTEKYNAYFLNQLTELLSNYGQVDEVWFDGANGEGPNGKKPVYHFEDWYRLIRKLQPNAIIAITGPDVRWVGTESGKGRTTEWSVVPVDQQENAHTAKDSQKDIAFPPQGDMTDSDLGSREKIVKAKTLAWYPAETDVSIRPGWFYHPAEDDKVKTPEQLMNIYFTSVGRNSVLLLNIPPNKQGLISASDQKSLKAWKDQMDATFKHNLLKGAAVKKMPMEFQYELKQAKTFDVLSLQEDIAKGQRVEKFRAEYWNGTKWVLFAEGTTIGYKRLIRFDPVRATKIRLKIESSRLRPFLSLVGLYKMAG
ncbi:alpha-L-fucosidase [Pedobacter nutrimenti]|jgi:alpha-L-fucosidase|uniref:alpha-L-fucosidase n=1 Tax=Pedobacter nutrimenti TaxID=1241337 RepID=A0A318UQP5_9SPHI|nr:alpha-L-fucosidase [Pedobacter nutrimenti]PYF77398.1 alpha-L-fucosidase [Pedobacter nutrimenti]